jgi:hypothetical protein
LKAGPCLSTARALVWIDAEEEQRTPEATLDGTEAVADATDSEESGAEPSDARLATARDTDVVKDIAVGVD